MMMLQAIRHRQPAGLYHSQHHKVKLERFGEPVALLEQKDLVPASVRRDTCDCGSSSMRKDTANIPPLCHKHCRQQTQNPLWTGERECIPHHLTTHYLYLSKIHRVFVLRCRYVPVGA